MTRVIQCFIKQLLFVPNISITEKTYLKTRKQLTRQTSLSHLETLAGFRVLQTSSTGSVPVGLSMSVLILGESDHPLYVRLMTLHSSPFFVCQVF